MVRTKLAGGKSEQFAVENIDTIFTFFTPRTPLSKYVDCFWFFEGHNPERRTEPILPTGRFELVINLRPKEEMRFENTDRSSTFASLSPSIVSGAHGRSFVPAAAEDICMIGMHFKPGGAFPFLGLPLSDLADAHVDLETLWGRDAVRLHERLSEVGTPLERFHLLEDALLARLRPGIDHHYAIPAALTMFANNRGGPIVREAARSLGLSERRLIQIFKSEIGITPKLFSRIQRFQRTRSLIRQDHPPDWASLAIDLGYFDQSHLINEFREFSGLTPTGFVNRDARFI